MQLIYCEAISQSSLPGLWVHLNLATLARFRYERGQRGMPFAPSVSGARPLDLAWSSFFFYLFAQGSFGGLVGLACA